MTESAAQGLAECTALKDCSLTAATVTGTFQKHIPGRGQSTLTSRYGTVPLSTATSVPTLPHQRELGNGPLLAPMVISLSSSDYRGWQQAYVADDPIALSMHDGRQLGFEPVLSAEPAAAFSYDLGRRWQFRADALDDNSVALQAIAAGSKRVPEDLLWHLSESDFSVNMELTRRF